MKICPKCNTEHNKPGKFCSRSCANSRTFTEDTNKKRGETISKWYNSLSSEEKKAINSKKTSPEIWDKRKETIKNKYSLVPFDDLSLSKKKAAILKEQEHKCLICGLDEWLGVPIKFELDHIDGNTLNNQRENLRILCPNCHSQTPTFRKGYKTKSPSEEEIINAYKLSSSMNELLSTLKLKWGSFVLVIKVLEKHGYTAFTG